MGHGHGHGGPASQRHRGRLAVVFALVAAFFVVELVYGLLASSLALLSDAGHMAADVVTLGAALAATRIATRTDRTGRRTFGSYRAEVFASGFAVLVMLGVSVYVVVEAVGRVGDDVEIQTGPVLVVGALGLLVDAVVADLRAVEGVDDVHDLHVWVLTSGMNVATAHLVAAGASTGPAALDRVLADARSVLRERHHVEHATLQVEGCRAPECHSVDW